MMAPDYYFFTLWPGVDNSYLHIVMFVILLVMGDNSYIL